MIRSISPLDDQVVLMGMSCVGKTTMSYLFKQEGYEVHHFDAKFKYNLTLPGISKIKNWEKIIKACPDKFVLDNWTTEDLNGKELYQKKPNACVYVLYDLYTNILDRYRVPVKGEDAYFSMYKKMYVDIQFENYKYVRYFRVDGKEYLESTRQQFREFVNANLTKNHGRFFNTKTWTWEKKNDLDRLL